jgi:hypothetical protein
MRYAATGIKLAICLASLSAGPAFTQTQSDEAIPDTTASAPVAYVYVQTSSGVNLYDAASNGSLTLVKGSPFKTVGEMIGSNGKFFITLGTDYVHSYAIESNGAIGKQVSEINSLDYTGGETIFLNYAGLDHTGQNLSVIVEYGSALAFQSFDIAKASGALTFKGSLVLDNSLYCIPPLFPSITANDKFYYWSGYNGGVFECGAPGPLAAFTRGSDGVLQVLDIRETDPTPWPNYQWILNSVAADATNHLAVVLYGYDGYTKYQQNRNVQLASYTEDAEGNLVSTNTYEDMPVPLVGPDIIRMSPSGKLLAVAGNFDPSDFSQPVQGLQIFHFNGAKPITPYSNVISTANFGQSSLHWDNNNHLYALGSPTKGTYQLFVYTITPTSISEAPGSPYTIKANWTELSTNSLVVVPK